VCGSLNGSAPQVPPVTPGRLTLVSPSSLPAAVNTSQTLKVTFTDSNGAGDFGVLNMLVNNAIDGRNACYVAYVVSSNTLFLVDDAGHAEGPYAKLVLNGGGSSIENSQCVISPLSSAVFSGNGLTLTLNVSFKSAFTGNRILYAAARDSTESNNTGWQAVGVWSVQ
jgi:hypothetical protein